MPELSCVKGIGWPPPIPGFLWQPDDNPRIGGMGEIYRVYQQSLGRHVCCKILRRCYLDRARSQNSEDAYHALTSGQERLIEEAELTASLRSRYVPAVHEYGEAIVSETDGDGCESTILSDTWPYYMMEWIDGPSLCGFLREIDGPWPAESEPAASSGRKFGQLSDEWRTRLLNIFAEIARALQDAHRQGVIHFDVTPRNVLLKDRVEVKLIDWGLAQRVAAGGDDGVSAVSTGAGSPDYMAPEQVGRETASFPADVYALGGIGYLLLTGKPPRSSSLDDKEAAAKKMRELASCPHHHAALYERLSESDAQPFWINLITKCLCQQPTGRYANAMEVVAEIDRYEVEQEHDKKEKERLKHKAELEKQEAENRLTRSRWILSATILLLLLVIATSGAVVFRLRVESETRRAEAEAERAKVAVTLAEAEAKEKQEEILARKHAQIHQRLTLAYAKWYKGHQNEARAEALEVLGQLEGLVADNRDDLRSRAFLAYAYATMGEMLASSDPALANGKLDLAMAIFVGAPPGEIVRRQLEDALGYYAKAIQRIEELPDSFQDKHESLDVYHSGQFRIYGRLHRFTESLIACDQALRWTTDAEKRKELQVIRKALLQSAEKEQSTAPWSRGPHPDHSKAMRLAAYLASAEDVSWAAIYNAACAYALAAADPAAMVDEQDNRKQQALGYLQQIAEKGYFRNEKRLKELLDDTEKDLASLNSLPAFQQLLRSAKEK